MAREAGSRRDCRHSLIASARIAKCGAVHGIEPSMTSLNEIATAFAAKAMPIPSNRRAQALCLQDALSRFAIAAPT
jgi:hypothetical protein